MIRHQVLDRQVLHRRSVDHDKFAGVITEIIGQVKERPASRPQAYLVEQKPYWTLPPHFHEEHQFQVFLEGGGTMGRHVLESLTVHYAAPHTAYGPIVAGDRGLSYLTLRAVGDVSAWYMPEAREHLNRATPKRVVHGAPETYFSAGEVQQLSEPKTEVLIKMDSDGLAAWICRVPPREHLPSIASVFDAGGRFYIVTQGSLLWGGFELGKIGTLFASREERLDLQAGAEGLEVLVLQFPVEAEQSFVEQIAGGRRD